jgi:hypothetical protein
MAALNAYMGYSRSCGSEEGACLIFAQTARKAKPLAYEILTGWHGIDWTDVAVKRLNEPHLFAEADPQKLADGIAHAIECPKTCNRCEIWGKELNSDGLCEDCIDETTDD